MATSPPGVPSWGGVHLDSNCPVHLVHSHMAELSGRQVFIMVTSHRPFLGQPFLSTTFQNLSVLCLHLYGVPSWGGVHLSSDCPVPLSLIGSSGPDIGKRTLLLLSCSYLCSLPPSTARTLVSGPPCLTPVDHTQGILRVCPSS